jgi:hypothetical protein
VKAVDLNAALAKVRDTDAWSAFLRLFRKSSLRLATRRGGRAVVRFQPGCGGVVYETLESPRHFARYRNLKKSLKVIP